MGQFVIHTFKSATRRRTTTFATLTLILLALTVALFAGGCGSSATSANVPPSSGGGGSANASIAPAATPAVAKQVLAAFVRYNAAIDVANKETDSTIAAKDVSRACMTLVTKLQTLSYPAAAAADARACEAAISKLGYDAALMPQQTDAVAIAALNTQIANDDSAGHIADNALRRDLGLPLVKVATTSSEAGSAASATQALDAEVQALEAQTRIANDDSVKEGIHSIEIGIQSYAVDHNGQYPPAAIVTATGLATYLDMWPSNPYTGAPMANDALGSGDTGLPTAGTTPGDFEYMRFSSGRSFGLQGNLSSGYFVVRAK